MNTLSWALYAAGALDSFKILLIVMAVVLGPGYLFATMIQRDSTSYGGGEPWPWPKAYVMTAILMAFVSCAVPSAKTVYLIAASEVGERVAHSPEGREMLDLIRSKIRDALSDKA